MRCMFNKRNVRLMLFIGSTILLVLQLPSYFSQKSGHDLQTGFSVSQSELNWLSASMLLEHHMLQEAILRYVNDYGGSDKADLLKHLNAYIYRFNAMGEFTDGYLLPFSISMDKGKPQHIDSSIFESNIESLQRDGLPKLREIEQKIQDLQPRGFSELFVLQKDLSDLGDQVTQFLLNGFDFSRHLNQEQIEFTAKVNQRLWYSQFSVIYGIVLFAIALVVYLHERQQAARMLRQTNRRLEVEIGESGRLAQELEQRATHDDLSGLLNRRGFSQMFESLLLSKDERHGLCFIDLDMFKIVNDTSGHSAGDTLIQVVADLLRNRIQKEGTVARFGGDEFLIVMPDCDKEYFESTIIELCDEMRQLQFNYSGKQFDVSGSFGAVHFKAGEHNSHSLMAIVDGACYEAKRAGGGRIHFHGDDDNILQARQKDIDWLNHIHHALNNNEFVLYYQPIHTSKSDGCNDVIHGWEVLLRMKDDDNKIVLPKRIFDVAERYSVAPRIDRWVVEHAFEWLNGNPAEFEKIECLNINLSGKSIGDKDFLNFLEVQTKKLTVDTSRVCFEITETAVAGKNACLFMSRLKQLGYQLALDDFGTGFSSFGYLESLPADYIKIDGLFVRDIDTNQTHREFVKAISAVGKAMGKSVVAEFVSNQKSVEILETLGVEYVQGFYIGEPAALPTLPKQVPKANDGTLLMGTIPPRVVSQTEKTNILWTESV